jgi:hypothetical protein
MPSMNLSSGIARNRDWPLIVSWFFGIEATWNLVSLLQEQSISVLARCADSHTRRLIVDYLVPILPPAFVA